MKSVVIFFWKSKKNLFTNVYVWKLVFQEDKSHSSFTKARISFCSRTMFRGCNKLWSKLTGKRKNKFRNSLEIRHSFSSSSSDEESHFVSSSRHQNYGTVI